MRSWVGPRNKTGLLGWELHLQESVDTSKSSHVSWRDGMINRYMHEGKQLTGMPKRHVTTCIVTCMQWWSHSRLLVVHSGGQGPRKPGLKLWEWEPCGERLVLKYKSHIGGTVCAQHLNGYRHTKIFMCTRTCIATMCSVYRVTPLYNWGMGIWNGWDSDTRSSSQPHSTHQVLLLHFS